MNYKAYLRKTITWRNKDGFTGDGYGESTTVDQTIKVRWEDSRKLVRNQQGEEVISESTVFCLESVQPGDILVDSSGKERVVISVSEASGLDGITSLREVMV